MIGCGSWGDAGMFAAEPLGLEMRPPSDDWNEENVYAADRTAIIGIFMVPGVEDDASSL